MPSLIYKFNGQEHCVPVGERVRIGRAEANDVYLPVNSLSRHHAVLLREGDRYILQDEGSANGILHEGERVGLVALTPGTRFQLGEIEFTFSAAAVPAQPPLAPSPPPRLPPEKIKVKVVEKGREAGGARTADDKAGAPAAPLPPVAEIVETKPAAATPLENMPSTASVVSPPPEIPVAVVAPPPLPAIPTVTAAQASPAPPPPSPAPPAEFPPAAPSAPLTSAPPVAVPALAPELNLTEHLAAVVQLDEARKKILAEIGKVIIGQKEVLNQILVALFARGHCLLIGVPGLAKTLMVRALGSAVDLDAKRIQFTPDLMPSDITGTDILEEDPISGKREFRFHRGPIFTNLLLADEINRTPPKTQAALLEAMQERRVTAAGQTYTLPDPFMVMATQNPIEQEGTYPLPEAQLDRFMFCVLMKYPQPEDEQRVLLETTRDLPWEVAKALDGPSILNFQHLVRQVPISEHVALYAMNLIRATRPETEGGPDFIKRWVRWGAGTRAGQYLLLSAKAQVVMEGRTSVSCADIRTHALPVLRHRIFCNFAAASEGVSTDDIIKKVLETVKEPEYAN